MGAVLWSTLSVMVLLMPADPKVEEVCAGARALPVPPEHRPDPKTTASLKTCSSEALYYGIGGPADPERARQCAYLQLDAGDQEVFGGSAMLMTIYANGVGAPRNLDLALRFACLVESAPAEREARVARLGRMKREQWKGTTFHLCDEITSGLMGGHCAAHDQRKKQPRRDAKLQALLASFSEPDRAAFTRLRAAADAYFKARTDNEVDLSGTARGALVIAEENRLEKALTAALEHLERKRTLPAKVGPLADVDAALNVEYRRVQSIKEPLWGTVDKAGITRTQRLWLKYRDAFVAFAKQRYPTLSSDQVQSWLTGVRTRMLKEFGD